jgi:hypothetical protein
MAEKLDDHINGELSIKSQKLRLQQKDSAQSARKSRNLAELKKKYKAHVKIEEDANSTTIVLPTLKKEFPE